jgi:hypothetical protein
MDDDLSRALLEGMEQMGQMVAMWSGIRQQFIESGWTPESAEAATLMMIQKMVEDG